MPIPPMNASPIVVTAARSPEPEETAPASVTVLDAQLIERLGTPLAEDLLRLAPSTSVSMSGPPGSLAEVRIRGAEANHTLLFIDGIRANDPATGDQPRFDLLNADIASRIEVVCGPQSALWGSDAIGGVVAVNGLAATRTSAAAQVEAGSFGFERASASGALRSKRASVEAAAGWQRASGIDSFNGQGDKDGYRNLSGRLRATYALNSAVQVGLAGFALSGRSEFDGYDPLTFRHADTLDNSRNRMGAGRLWASIGKPQSAWGGTVSASLLGSSNRNDLANIFLNRTSGTRRDLEAQVEHRVATGTIDHELIAAVQSERETFRASDAVYGGATDQNRTRENDSITLEWRASARAITTDVAVRRDMFNRFRDSTTLRGSLLVALGSGVSLAGSYGEGIAQPTFFDLYGFFPQSFSGNPTLKPESSRGFEASLRFRRGRLKASLTGYRQRLHDEIIDVFDPVSFNSSTANRIGASHRSGLEAELHWTLSPAFRVTASYSYLDATEPGATAAIQLREVRRPRHSGSLAIDGAAARISYGAALTYTGPRRDTDFDVIPAEGVTLHGYWLAQARVGYRLSHGVELFARAQNALDAHYQDVFGYRTQGRSLYAGICLGGG